MTGSQLLGFALLMGPFLGCVWAWIQWHREQLHLTPAVLELEPDVDRQDHTPGRWDHVPWATLPAPMQEPELR